MPLIDDFPTCLREELEAAYEEDLDEVFDVSAVRSALDERLKALESELHQVQCTLSWLRYVVLVCLSHTEY
jgi:hypothetical protein